MVRKIQLVGFTFFILCLACWSAPPNKPKPKPVIPEPFPAAWEIMWSYGDDKDENAKDTTVNAFYENGVYYTNWRDQSWHGTWSWDKEKRILKITAKVFDDPNEAPTWELEIDKDMKVKACEREQYTKIIFIKKVK